MPRVVHFEIHASDPERAVAFYRELFGWTLQKWEGPMDYWLVGTGAAPAPGIDGGLVRRRGPAPAEGQAVNAFVCTVDVDQLDETLARAAALGATTAVPKMAVPGVGWLAYVKDPDGNILGLMQADAMAQ
jgi:predicted enzyme related to lactoylglutathione lyase